MMKRVRPFVLPANRPTDARPTPASRNVTATPTVGLSDIVFVSGDSVRVCRADAAGGPLLDGSAPLSLCRDNGGEPAALVNGLRVTQVSGVLMLRVE